MSKPILVDTDVMVDFLRGQSAAVAFVRKNSTRMMLSCIVAAELYAGVRDDDERATLDALLSLFRTVAVTSEIARMGGLFKREYAKSHGVGLADAILAATAVAEGAELKTLNVRHYPMIKGLTPAYRKMNPSSVPSSHPFRTKR
jgi:predicted nucleic acid-binding protein